MSLLIKAVIPFLFCFPVFCSGQAGQNKNLVAWYPFNGNVNDASGNHNDPVFNNASLTADRFGNANSAYHFNGVNAFMKIPNNPSLNMGSEITISVWVRPTGFYHGICHASTILSKGLGNYMPGDYTLRFDDALYTRGNGCGDAECDSLHQNFRGTGTTLANYVPFVEKNKWYSVVYTNDGEMATLYVDCMKVYSVKFSETFTNNSELFIGRTDDSFFPFWLNADLDDVRIYNKAMDTATVFALCHGTIPVEKVEIPTLPVHLEERKNEVIRQIDVDHDSVTVSLYDNGIVDGDSVTLIFNKEILITHLMLTEQAKNFIIKIDRNSPNELIMYAENMGSIPPNTALMVIHDGEKRYEVNVRSTENTNGTVRFRLKE